MEGRGIGTWSATEVDGGRQKVDCVTAVVPGCCAARSKVQAGELWWGKR